MDDVHLRLRLLHLSDLHARAGRESEPWRRRRVLGRAWLRRRCLIDDEERLTIPVLGRFLVEEEHC